jgi:tetratricopeptide (TPR) repeat protein
VQKKYSSYRLPEDLEELSEFSNQDLRLSPEYAEVEEAYRKIKSFQEAVDLLEESEASYHDSARAVGSAWPEAYEAFVSMDEALEEVPDKLEAEQVMNSGFDEFKDEHGEVETRRRELEDAIEDARKAYQAAAGRLASQIKSSLFLGRETPLKHAKKASDSEAFDRRAERLEKGFVRPENATGERVRRLLDGTDRP